MQEYHAACENISRNKTNKQTNRYRCLMLEGAKEIISEDAHRQWKEYSDIYSQRLHVNKRQRCGTRDEAVP